MAGSRRARARRRLSAADRIAIAAAVLAAVAGAAVLIFVPGLTGSVVGACLLGVAAVALVSLLFLLVGESEERDYRQDGR